MKEKGWIYEDEQALWFKATSFGVEKDEVVVRANGIPTYFAADIAYHRNKFQRGFERVINVWGADHHGHVARMKGAVAALGYDPAALEVVIMQLVRLYKGGEIVRMSKRTGQFVTLEELVDEVGRDAARYFFVMRSPDSHLDFDLDLAKSESNDNPVIISSTPTPASAAFSGSTRTGRVMPQPSSVDFIILQEEYEFTGPELADFPGSGLGSKSRPQRIARYLHELLVLLHSFYNSHRVITSNRELTMARLLLVEATRITLKTVWDCLV